MITTGDLIKLWKNITGEQKHMCRTIIWRKKDINREPLEENKDTLVESLLGEQRRKDRDMSVEQRHMCRTFIRRTKT